MEKCRNSLVNVGFNVTTSTGYSYCIISKAALILLSTDKMNCSFTSHLSRVSSDLQSTIPDSHRLLIPEHCNIMFQNAPQQRLSDVSPQSCCKAIVVCDMWGE